MRASTKRLMVRPIMIFDWRLVALVWDRIVSCKRFIVFPIPSSNAILYPPNNVYMYPNLITKTPKYLRLRKMFIGKARESFGVRRIFTYAAITRCHSLANDNETRESRKKQYWIAQSSWAMTNIYCGILQSRNIIFINFFFNKQLNKIN